MRNKFMRFLRHIFKVNSPSKMNVLFNTQKSHRL
jgi:hypothetical protein